MAIIRLDPNIAGFTKQLRDGVRGEMFRKLNAKIAIDGRKISKQVGKYLASELEKSAVIKSLMGQGPTDLAAHFGIKNAEAKQLAQAMLRVVRNSVEISTQKTQLAGVIKIRAINKNYREFLKLPGAKYISYSTKKKKTRKYVIPIMKWMLIDPATDIFDFMYDIVFLGEESGKYDISIKRYSRSRRAITVPLKQLIGRTQYQLPEMLWLSGKNFIDFILSDPAIIEKAVSIAAAGLRR